MNLIIIRVIIIILIKRYSLTRVKLTALYKHLMTKNTLTYISTKRTLNIIVYHYRLSNNIYIYGGTEVGGGGGGGRL